MKRARGTSALGGLLAGALLGAVLGALDAVTFLKPPNLADSPWRSFLFLALSVATYSVGVAIAGTLVGAMSSLVRRARPRIPNPSRETELVAAFVRTLAIVTGVTLFVLAAWRVRMTPPDLAVFRPYCLRQTLLAAIGAAVVGGIVYLVARRFARLRPVTRWLSSRLIRRWTLIKLAVLAVLLGAVLLFEPVARGPAAETEGRGANVVLISIDTLRADHLEYLGYGKPTSPFMEELAGQSVVFREAICQFPLTSPSQASILTSRYARSHGSTDNAVPIHDSAVLLSEVLRAHGYSTAAFVTNRLCGIDYGFARGFDYYVEAGRGDLSRSRLVDWICQLRIVRVWWRLTGRERLTVALGRWLDDRPDEPFFLWYHQLVPHSPYAPPLAYEVDWDDHRSGIIPTTKTLGAINRRAVSISDEDLAHIINLYDAEIEFTDDLLRELFDALRRNGLLENTLVVFTADHGESLFDRSGYIGHGEHLYDEEIRVPLFFYSPRYIQDPRVIVEPVETMHIAPTILDFLDLPPEPSFQGMSLWGMTVVDSTTLSDSRPLHPQEEKPVFAEHKDGKMVRYEGWKHIRLDCADTAELYDLKTDPGETRNLIAEQPGQAARLGNLLEKWDASVPTVRSGDHKLDEEALDLLRSLGYVD